MFVTIAADGICKTSGSDLRNTAVQTNDIAVCMILLFFRSFFMSRYAGIAFKDTCFLKGNSDIIFSDV